MRSEAARRERFLPYRYARAGLISQIDRCVLDDRDQVEPDRDGHVIPLDVAWTTATISLSVEVPTGTRTVAIPPGAGFDALEILVVLRCAPTLLRVAFRAPVAERGTPILVQLRRDEVAVSAQLQAFLVLAADLPGLAGYGTQRGVRLADARSWELRVDRVREIHGEYLEVRYHPFSKEPTIPAHARKNLYLLQLEQDVPELWINADHERITAVLDSKGTVGNHARLREVAFDHIAHGVWTQLFLNAAREYVQTGEAVHAWQDAVLDQLLRDMYPEVASTAERRERMSESWEDLTQVLIRLDSTLQRRNELTSHLTKLIEEADGA